ncbi:Ger(x)C family spore germination protein [Clostridium botulinum]|uniref:Germination protein, Ger(X)C family n=1 Tax=Clostridium botulinum (strain Langeland / NCTC 10281 / Type F) TaxID=441772 RepID=A7G9M8_CLOBL|nr:Ger(x)C family spore germination protein [Clostridium botulinum]ABS41428.1 germination protein, Ger(x)C family [Clostridium botulinum F str. Langeland]ADF97966.1 germination protein, Ger(x)C family [Clostridium botulinum F str. 230613]KKM41680.1 spore gernimation protein GerC [Clostridium botulinum]MBY6792862.1 Ger(x)C family spore germination protein [Clostridium botulinum]MBY6938509.1 Ger(x)C family spore germination protein [Clostridium botulinum]
MKSKKCLVIMLILLTICMTGCWDKVEIDQKAFTSVLGVDAGKDIGKEKQLKEISDSASFTGSKLDKIKVTYAFPDISKLGPEKGGTAVNKTMSVDAYSMQDSIDKVINKSSRNLNFGHLKLMVLNTSILDYSNTFKEVIDYLQRQPSINRMIYIVFSEDKSEEILKFKPSMEKSVENYIIGILENNKKNNTSSPLTLNEFLEETSENNTALIPVINIDKKSKDLKISKVAVIKDDKIKGYISTEQANSIQLINKKFKGGTRTIIRDGSPLDYSIENSDRRIKIKDKKKLSFDIKLNLEGQIKGYNIDKQISSKGNIKEIEDNLNKAVTQDIKEVIRVSQAEYNTDILDLGEFIHKYHPKLWKEIKGNWNELYKTVDINVSVDTKVRRIGGIK